MEHEVYVPFSVGSVRAALAERERVARCVPGLQTDAATGTGDSVQGRLRVRIGGSTITYRGSLTLIPQGDGFTVEGSGTEARGSGTVKLALKLVPRVAEDAEGTRLTCSGTVTRGGRLADIEDKTATSAGRRLLDRFCSAFEESLRTDGTPGDEEPDAGGAADTAGTADTGGANGADRAADSGDAGDAADAGDAESAEGEAHIDARQAAGLGEPDDNDRAIPGIPGPEKGERHTGAEKDERDAEAPSVPEEETTGGIFETEVPPPSLDPLSDDVDEETSDEDAAAAEAAHARRTMIGRSAEEVDHAPPRGRYAPVPSPEPSAAADTLRWAAPAAAAVLAGAVILTRALRRRR